MEQCEDCNTANYTLENIAKIGRIMVLDAMLDCNQKAIDPIQLEGEFEILDVS